MAPVFKYLATAAESFNSGNEILAADIPVHYPHSLIEKIGDVFRRNMPDIAFPGIQQIHFWLINVEANNFVSLFAEQLHQWQAYISQPDDADFGLSRQNLGDDCLPLCTRLLLSHFTRIHSDLSPF